MVVHASEEDYVFKGVRSRKVVTLLGPVVVRRAYFHRRGGGAGRCPRDRLLGLDSQILSPAARRTAARFGACDSFGPAALCFHEATGVRIAESTLERVCEAAGRRIALRQDAGETFGGEAWEWSLDARGSRVGYVALDATGTPQQGPGGSKAEHKMAYVGRLYSPPREEGPAGLGLGAPMHESNDSFSTISGESSAIAADGRPPRGTGRSRYAARLGGLDEVCGQLQREGAAAGAEKVEQWVMLSDGGGGLEERLRLMFGAESTVCILDFWHAKEYLAELAGAWFADAASEAERKAWMDRACRRLKHEGGRAVLSDLERWSEMLGRPPAGSDGAAAAVDVDEGPPPATCREALGKASRYYRNHVERMDYPRYVRNGWQIGSGPAESACKYVVKKRLAGSGRRWSPEGADAMIRLRALQANGEKAWNDFWASDSIPLS